MEKFSEQPNSDELTDAGETERPKEACPDSTREGMAEALKDQLASDRQWLEAFAGMAGKLRFLALIILLLVLAGLGLVWVLQGIVTGLETGVGQ